ncbi:phage tail tip lysozyme [Jeotgalibaca arthritidis]|uniref:phage tail tip lysozyme n=1 Tax=Jeotgalibaca arthritidis TaxID=1868794 RepID=UPI0035A13A1C
MIYVYEQMPSDLAINGDVLIDWADLPEISRTLNDKFTFYGNYKLNGQNAKLLKENHFIKALTENGTWQYFEIFNVQKNLYSISITARFLGAMANKNFIEKSYTASGNGTRIMNDLKNALAFPQKFTYTSNIPTVHQFTASQVKPIDAIIGSNNGNQNLVGVTGGEFDVDNYDLKLVKQIGVDNNYRIDFGVNLEAIETEIDNECYNSLYLIGAIPENDYDGDKEPITFKYLEVAGVTDANRRIAKRENSNCKTTEELKEWGQTLFDKERIHEVKATHHVNMVALEHTLEYGELYRQLTSLHFGDIAYCYVPELDLDLRERMVEYTWFPTLQKYKSVVLGNSLSKYTSRVQTETQKLADKIANRTETLVQTILDATAWITGNKGGHVVFRPEKAPSEILIMDTQNVATAKRVWRWNLNGLGYSDNGINGPFGVAITSKGEIVANFIKVGTISVDVFESSFNEMGDQLKIVAGALEAWNEGKKIMSLTKRGMEFWNSMKQKIGEIGTTQTVGNPFPDAQTPEPLDDNSIVVKTNGKVILISPNKNKGFVMLGNGLTLHFGDLNVQDDLTATNLNVLDRIDVKELYVDGVRLIPGQGGGGGDWNGTYPPGVTSSADKFAWQAWAILIGKGYSKQAVAGILGNIQGEVGPAMNPDMEQVGGPAYGAVQWDGSAYPLVGSPTWNGREYVQRLMGAAGITKDYTTMSAQMDLLDWCMYNGQWIGAVSPTTVAGFKAITDPAQAAHAFERNFERPAVAHPEREGWAVTWYNKFKDLQISTGGAWRAPIDNPITITSEFGWRTSPINGGQELHNGIDLVGGTGATTNIYASGPGTVVFAGWENSYGNYVIIQHANGLFTGYAHNSSLSVANGDVVTQGQKIANMGSTGSSTNPHTHFQFFRNGPWPSSNSDFINPREYINF